MIMSLPPEYSWRVQLCIRCAFGSSRAACSVDGKQYHDHALSGECPKDVYEGGAVTLGATLRGFPVTGEVLEQRRAVCEGCPIGSFDGWAGPTVVRCREMCRTCNTHGMLDISAVRCPRGHHEG